MTWTKLLDGLIPVDMAPTDDASIACPDCMRWRFQVLLDDEQVFVREWHQPDCAIFDQDRGEATQLRESTA